MVIIQGLMRVCCEWVFKNISIQNYQIAKTSLEAYAETFI